MTAWQDPKSVLLSGVWSNYLIIATSKPFYHVGRLPTLPVAFGDLMGSEMDPRSEVVKVGWKIY